MLAGDERALRRFMDEYFPRLYRYLVLRMRNRDDVEDLVQVTLTQAARKLETYRGEASLLTWLITIARHEMHRHLQREAAREDRTTTFLNDELLSAVVEALASESEASPEWQRRRQEVTQLVQLTLDQLPEHYATALELKYIEGFSSLEIGSRLGLSDAATQSLLARARRAFREICGEALHQAWE
ncbi:RNA polymerase sigma factor [Parahaliea maris]|nr:RNA polymerase sigma factor [Parahaliea maris]